MKHKATIFGLLAIVLLTSLGIWAAQGQPRSPRMSAEMTLEGKKISVDYGAPSMRGRKIFGELVPYGQIWRMGANKATHLTTEADLILGGVSVPAGAYTLFILPSESGMKMIINKQTGQWGIPYKPEYEKTELSRVDMKVEKTKAPVEQMVISLASAGRGGVLKLDWENTSASVAFSIKK
ncbi:MAG: DUF2911 domain-containing protein [Acidobacteriota bacterium]|nr:MAG: DUF2911 domain-containing protein [Acidobacteriota bacterium]